MPTNKTLELGAFHSECRGANPQRTPSRTIRRDSNTLRETVSSGGARSLIQPGILSIHEFCKPVDNQGRVAFGESASFACSSAREALDIVMTQFPVTLARKTQSACPAMP